MEGMGIGIGAIGMGVSPVPMGMMGGLNGPLGASPTQTAQPAQLSTIQQQQLSQLLEGLSSADLLLALMVAAGSSRCRKKDDDSGAMALLAGLAMAARMSDGGNPQGAPQPIQDWSSISGQSLNVTA